MNRYSRVLTTASAIAVAVSTLMAGTPAQAQQTELDALRTQIEALQNRLEQLESAQATQTTAGTPAVANSKVPLTVSGLLQVHSLNFFGQEDGPANSPFARRPDTFRLRRGEIRLTAPSITSRISGTIMIDPAKTLSGSTNIGSGTNLNLRARDNILQEIQISYLLNKNQDNTRNAFVDVGQFKIPVGYEGDLVSSAALQTVERALFFTQRDTTSGSDSGYGDVRETGVQLRGTTGPIDYRLGVFNGIGDRQNALATTDAKSVIGRLVFKPAGIAGLQLGVSGATGGSGLGANNTRFDRQLLNAFAVYKKDKLTLQTEYLQGESQLRNAATSNEVRGYYGSVGYLFTPKLEGVLRYDSFDANRNAAPNVNTETKDITLGVNYYIKGNNAKIQTNLVRRQGAAGSPIADLRPDRTELRTNFQVAF